MVPLDLHSVPGGQNTDWHSDNITGQPLFWQYRCFQDQVVTRKPAADIQSHIYLYCNRRNFPAASKTDRFLLLEKYIHTITAFFRLLKLDRVVKLCQKYELFVILDLHSVPGGQNTDWHSDNIHKPVQTPSKS